MFIIAICDDEVLFLEELKKQILKHPMCPEDAQVIMYLSGEELLEDIDKEYDLVILDMQMEGLDGRETARRLRNDKGNHFVLGFFTGKVSPVSSDFELHPSRYIMKTANKEDTDKNLNALLLEMIDRKKEEYYMCTYFGRTEKINVKDIMYISNTKNGSEIVYRKGYAKITKKKSSKCNKKIKDIFEELPQDKFAYIQKNFVANMEYIIRIDGNYILFEDNVEVGLSRAYKGDFKCRLAQYHKKYFNALKRTEKKDDETD